jgi:hypothetical protein
MTPPGLGVPDVLTGSAYHPDMINFSENVKHPNHQKVPNLLTGSAYHPDMNNFSANVKHPNHRGTQTNIPRSGNNQGTQTSGRRASNTGTQTLRANMATGGVQTSPYSYGDIGMQTNRRPNMGMQTNRPNRTNRGDSPLRANVATGGVQTSPYSYGNMGMQTNRQLNMGMQTNRPNRTNRGDSPLRANVATGGVQTSPYSYGNMGMQTNRPNRTNRGDSPLRANVATGGVQTSPYSYGNMGMQTNRQPNMGMQTNRPNRTNRGDSPLRANVATGGVQTSPYSYGNMGMQTNRQLNMGMQTNRPNRTNRGDSPLRANMATGGAQTSPYSYGNMGMQTNRSNRTNRGAGVERVDRAHGTDPIGQADAMMQTNALFDALMDGNSQTTQGVHVGTQRDVDDVCVQLARSMPCRDLLRTLGIWREGIESDEALRARYDDWVRRYTAMHGHTQLLQVVIDCFDGFDPHEEPDIARMVEEHSRRARESAARTQRRISNTFRAPGLREACNALEEAIEANRAADPIAMEAALEDANEHLNAAMPEHPEAVRAAESVERALNAADPQVAAQHARNAQMHLTEPSIPEHLEAAQIAVDEAVQTQNRNRQSAALDVANNSLRAAAAVIVPNEPAAVHVEAAQNSVDEALNAEDPAEVVENAREAQAHLKNAANAPRRERRQPSRHDPTAFPRASSSRSRPVRTSTRGQSVRNPSSVNARRDEIEAVIRESANMNCDQLLKDIKVSGSQSETDKRYRKWASKFHPDRTRGLYGLDTTEYVQRVNDCLTPAVSEDVMRAEQARADSEAEANAMRRMLNTQKESADLYRRQGQPSTGPQRHREGAAGRRSATRRSPYQQRQHDGMNIDKGNVRRQEENAMRSKLAAERARQEREKRLQSRLKGALKQKKTISKPRVTRSATRRGRMGVDVDNGNEMARQRARQEENARRAELAAERARQEREKRLRLWKRTSSPSSIFPPAKRRMSEPARSAPAQQNSSGMAKHTRVVTARRRQARSARRRSAWGSNPPPPTAGNGERNSASAHVNAAIVEVVNGGDPLTVNAHLNAAAEHLEDEPDPNVAAAVGAVRVAANTRSPEAAALNMASAQSHLNNANNHNREALPPTNVKTSASANEEARVANTKSAGPSWFNPLAHVAGFLSGIRQNGGATRRRVESERNRNRSPVRTATPNERDRNRSPIRTETPREPVVRNKGKTKVNNDRNKGKRTANNRISKPVTVSNSVPENEFQRMLSEGVFRQMHVQEQMQRHRTPRASGPGETSNAGRLRGAIQSGNAGPSARNNVATIAHNTNNAKNANVPSIANIPNNTRNNRMGAANSSLRENSNTGNRTIADPTRAGLFMKKQNKQGRWLYYKSGRPTKWNYQKGESKSVSGKWKWVRIKKHLYRSPNQG